MRPLRFLQRRGVPGRRRRTATLLGAGVAAAAGAEPTSRAMPGALPPDLAIQRAVTFRSTAVDRNVTGIRAEFPEITGHAVDGQAHFYASAKLLRLTDVGRTSYGTALIGMEQVRRIGMRKELSDAGFGDAQIAASPVMALSSKSLRMAAVIDELVAEGGFDDADLRRRLEDFVGTFRPYELNTLIAPHAWKGHSAYGKALLRWYGEQKGWFEEILFQRGFDAGTIAAHPVTRAFEALQAMAIAEDRMVVSLRLDQSDLLYDLAGIAAGLGQDLAMRDESFSAALDARGEQDGLSVADFYRRHLGGAFTDAVGNIARGIAEGRVSARYITHAHVVSSNLPRERVTLVDGAGVRMTYRPVRNDAWTGVVMTSVRVPDRDAAKLAATVLDVDTIAEGDAPAREEAMAAAVESAREQFAQAVLRAGLAERAAEWAER
jgi:hypothetical protein